MIKTLAMVAGETESDMDDDDDEDDNADGSARACEQVDYSDERHRDGEDDDERLDERFEL